MGFTDTDWGSGDDTKCITSIAFMFNSAAISCKSNKQTTVSLSSTEAEFLALPQATQEFISLQALLYNLGARKHIAEVCNIQIDNQDELVIAKTTEFYVHSKYIYI